MKQMHELQSNHKIIHHVRALGLIIGIELRKPETGEKAIDEAEQMMYGCLELELKADFSMIDEALSGL